MELVFPVNEDNVDGLACLQGTDAVGHDAVFGPVAAADNIAGTHAGQAHVVLHTVVGGVEKTATPRTDGYLAGSFRRTVGVVAAHRVGFDIAFGLFLVFVAFVGRHHHGHTHAVSMANGFHHVDGAHDVGLVGLGWDVVTEAYQWLSSQMEHDFGTVGVEDGLHLLTVANHESSALCPTVRSCRGW